MLVGLELLFYFLCPEKEEVRFLREVKKRSPKGCLIIELPPTDWLVRKITFENFPSSILEVVPNAKNIYLLMKSVVHLELISRRVDFKKFPIVTTNQINGFYYMIQC